MLPVLPVLPVQLVPMPAEPIETLLHDLDGDDVDGDDTLDLAITRAGANIVSLSLCDGAGSFGTLFERPTGGVFPASLAVADLDGNGTLDVVIGNRDNGVPNVSVFEGLADTGWLLAARRAFPQVSTPDGITRSNAVTAVTP